MQDLYLSQIAGPPLSKDLHLIKNITAYCENPMKTESGSRPYEKKLVLQAGRKIENG
jgi:hypothetical protein